MLEAAVKSVRRDQRTRSPPLYPAPSQSVTPILPITSQTHCLRYTYTHLYHYIPHPTTDPKACMAHWHKWCNTDLGRAARAPNSSWYSLFRLLRSGGGRRC
jgi:hypothetical protein